jgi:TolB-like protein/Flp pilus assembly protein TadD
MLPALGAEVSDEAAFALQHIVDRCLAKEPNERYQTLKEAAIDLRNTRRRLESAPVSPPAPSHRRWPWLYLAAGAAAVLIAVVLLWLVLSSPKEEVRPVEPTAATASKPSIAVLYFENTSGDPDLDWLRTGLTDMLVTDLSQSPHVEVLSTDRLYQILRDMNRLDERVTSLDVVQEVAEKAQAQNVVLGSFMKAGDTVRINIRVQDAASGKILTTEKIEGTGESAVFPMVDELTQRIKTSFEVPLTEDPELDRQLTDVTTSSVEALRLYVEGKKLWYGGKRREAAALYVKALELDPGFAMAMTGLSEYYGPASKEGQQYARMAMEHADRLTKRERLYIQGRYYHLKQETFSSALETYSELLDLYPDHFAARSNMGYLTLLLERYAEAVVHFEELKRRDFPFISSYGMLARSSAGLGRFDDGYQVWRDYIEQNPNSLAAYERFAHYLILIGRLDEALQALETAESLGAVTFYSPWARWRIFVLRDDLEGAEKIARESRISQDRDERLSSSCSLAITRLIQGHFEEALTILNEAEQVFGQSDTRTAFAHNYMSRILIERDQPGLALEHAQMAQMEGRGNDAEWEGLFLASLALGKLNEWEEAERTAETLRLKAESLPTDKEKRRYRHLLGELALLRNDAQAAILEFENAEAMLPAGVVDRSLILHVPFDLLQHVPIWYSLARAHLAAGDEDKAAAWFERIAESGFEHLWWPIPYVRSFYFLGKIHENRGEMEEAREYYRRFYKFWENGDMDHERLDEVRAKLH